MNRHYFIRSIDSGKNWNLFTFVRASEYEAKCRIEEYRKLYGFLYHYVPRRCVRKRFGYCFKIFNSSGLPWEMI